MIQGAGGLGIYATAVAKELGAGKVIVIDGIQERLDLARDFGADELIDFRELRDEEARIQRVMELTDGWGADVVAELVGHPRVCPEGIKMVGRAGRYLEIGNISPGLTYTLDPQWLVGHNRSILGMVYYEAEHLQQALDLVQRTRDAYPWDRVLSHKLPLEQINEAFELADQGKVTRAAIVP
ncbi:MAG: zinc-binding dehydrogenase [Chloroflexota bacterium]|nr:zinc-binding dehydrogenase [Chloroflexota bacterium]